MTASRRTPAVVLSFALALAAPVTSAEASGPAGWDHPGFDAEDSYYNPGESAINAASVGAMTRRWSQWLRMNDGSCGTYSSPLVAAGKVIASDQLGISAYQALTGAPLWHFDWEDPEDTDTPLMAVSGNTLIAANGDCHSNSDPNGRLSAIDLSTGKLRWRVNSDMPISTLSVDKGVAAVSGSSPSDELATTAYRVTDGKQSWRRAEYDSSGISADGRLLTTKGKSTVALSITTGAPLWTKPALWQAKSATPSADRFLVTNGTAMSAINSTTGDVLWTAPGKASDQLATDGRRVYRAADKTVEALNATTGRPEWSRSLPKPASQPVRAGGLLYTGGPILSAATGAIITQAKPQAGSQIPTGGRLYTVNYGELSSFAP